MTRTATIHLHYRDDLMRRLTLSLLAILLASFTLSTATIAAPPEVVKAAAVLPVPDSSQIWTAIESLEQRVDRLEKQSVAAPVRAVQLGQNCPGGVCPLPSRTVTRSVSSYSPRWQNHDGQSLRDHAINEHGFASNLSDAQLFQMHDAYHDQYGGAPPAMRSRSVTVQSPYVSNCPGGQCPTSRSMSVQSSGGVFGFGLFGRRH